MARVRFLHRSWLLFAVCVSSWSLAAESGVSIDAARTPGPFSWLDDAGGWLETQRDSFSETVNDSAVGIDTYLARDIVDEALINQSYLRVRFQYRLEKSGYQKFETNIRAKVKLPNTRKRWKLTFDSNPDDFESLSNRRRDQVSGSDSVQNVQETAVAGLSLDKYLGKNWDRNYSIGMKLRLPLDPYAKVSWVHAVPMGALWTRRFKEEISYFHTEGWKNETSLDFFRPISDSLLFQSGSAAQFLDKEDNWELLQSLSLHQRISINTNFEHQVGVSGLSRPSVKASGYWIRSEWRQRLYKDWLYAKVAPELYWGRNSGFHLEPSLFFIIESYFGRPPGS